MPTGRPSNKLKALKPYLLLSICALLAYAPVSFMLFSLKNDVVALEYPINFFMSECIRNGEWPAWFNTWGMGFPLQSNLTWGIFSTPRMIFSGLFNYNIYILHVEFIFFIMLAGWSMYYLLKRFFLHDKKLVFLLSASYMLSGFITGSSQWLLYITAASFIPLLISSLLHLLEKPGWKYSIQFAAVYTIMFTSIYAAFSIIVTYSILFFLIIKISGNIRAHLKTLKFLAITAAVTLVLCGPVLYFSLEVLGHLERGKGLSSSSEFFNSNYLHPLSLQGWLFPFAYGKMNFPNTEGSMLNSYMGLFVLCLLPVTITFLWKQKNKLLILLLLISLLFLCLSFGDLLPLRKVLNWLPGFGYFRNPALFRLFFMIGLLLTIAKALKEQSLDALLSSRPVMWAILIFTGITAVIIALNYSSLAGLDRISVISIIRSMGYHQALCIAAIIQLPFLLSLWIATKNKRPNLAFGFFTAELMINVLACGIFFTYSSYSPGEVNALLRIKKGFPVQTIFPSEARATLNDERMNTWQNVNVFSKIVSSDSSYRGPLVLETATPSIKGMPLVSAPFDPMAKIEMLIQRPGHIKIRLTTDSNTVITLAQNKYPGWKTFINDRLISEITSIDSRTALDNKKLPEGISIVAGPGESTIDFIYERNFQKYFAILLHITILSWLVWKLATALKWVNRSSSLS